MTVDEASKYLRSYGLSAHEGVYRRGSGNSFFLDSASAFRGADPVAQRRLDAHNAELRAGLTTTVDAGGSLAAPEYISTLFADAAVAASPFINLIPHYELGKTSAVYTPQIVEAPSVQAWQTQNVEDTGTESSLTDRFNSNPVAMFTSSQLISKQLQRQASLPVDEWLAPQLGDAVGAAANAACWSGSGSSGQFIGVDSLSGVTSQSLSASNSVIDALATAYQTVYANRLRRATHWFVSPADYGWFCAIHDGEARPWVLPHADGPSAATDDLAGSVMGMDIVVDATVTLGVSYVLRAADFAWFSNPITLNVFEETFAGAMETFVAAIWYGSLVSRYQGLSVVRLTGMGDVTSGS